MAYSYHNDSGKLVAGAAANSHKIYSIFGGPTAHWAFAVTYAVVGLFIVSRIRKGLHEINSIILEKR